jgi:hypothetical protein
VIRFKPLSGLTMETSQVTDSSEPVPATDAKPKTPRRRLTPEQRIANRKAEIERIEEQRREKVRGMLAEARTMLDNAATRAADAGMREEESRCRTAIEALGY